ncbi:MAG: hypothetical protein WKG07_21300 [Hymenobacter sp.]
MRSLPMNARFLTHFAAFALACFAVLFGLRAAFGAVVVHPLAPGRAGCAAGAHAGHVLVHGLGYRALARPLSGGLFWGVGLRLLLGIGLVLALFFSGRPGRKSRHSDLP